jgi:putative FmdB family regulatory protein
LPRYDYECQACLHVFEVKQSFSSEPVAECPKCGSGARRLIHAVPIVFKGSGFYVNDYGKGKSPTSSSAESKESSADSDSGSDSKSDSKTDGKVGTKSGAKADSKKQSASTE